MQMSIYAWGLAHPPPPPQKGSPAPPLWDWGARRAPCGVGWGLGGLSLGSWDGVAVAVRAFRKDIKMKTFGARRRKLESVIRLRWREWIEVLMCGVEVPRPPCGVVWCGVGWGWGGGGRSGSKEQHGKT